MNGQPHNKDLEELLKNFKVQKTEGLDDFEKEALEGFETLDSKEEALNIKSELDKRIREEVFTNKNQQHKVYWFAAAGLFIVIGLSVYFILNNQTVNEKNVAYVPTTEIKEQEKEKTMNVPAEETVPVAPVTKHSVPNNLKSMESTKKEEQISSRSIIKPAQSADKTNTPEDIVTLGKKDDVDMDNKASGEINNRQPSKDANYEAAKVAEFKQAEEKTEREAPGKEVFNDKLAKTETKVADEEVKKESKKRAKDNKRKEQPASTALAESDDAKAPSEKSAVNTVVAASGASVKQNDNATQPRNTFSNGAGKDQKSSAPAYSENEGPKAGRYNSQDNTCYYLGGETALTKDLREKLTDKKINKKFDVLLLINENKKVEKVNYLNIYDLTAEERDKVTEVLKTLNKFNFYIQPNTKGLVEYKLLYRP